ncbi:hypothetical protein H6G41_27940 [Tolypothrix sp. FACHB-123]|uniref:hypothetical protein n=1 Tax=Tolypothrix sp. FACHB-123 TaxID=2692868 RepID=UPI001689D8AA|nr:hypothetical protein [Tolypothrix sp. FACHB-123]MBD2358396.1 hypothetical protein [Tolypothrix sp. FACHB-123]
MHRRQRLILNLAIACLLTMLIIGDRSPSPYFELSIATTDEQSIAVPRHLLHCQLTQTLYCKIPIDHQALIVEEIQPPSLNCRARFGKQTPTCIWFQASALDAIFIEGLELTPIQIGYIKHSIKPLPTLRIFENHEVNGSFLLGLFWFFSIFSGFNVAESVFFYTPRFYRHKNQRIKTTVVLILSAIAGLGVICFLLINFLWLLLKFGYLGW